MSDVKKLQEVSFDLIDQVTGGNQELVSPQTTNTHGWYNPVRWFGGGQEVKSCAINRNAYRQEPVQGRRDRWVLTPAAQQEHRNCRRNHLGLIGD